MIVHFDDGSSTIFEGIEGLYIQRDNWREGEAAGKAVEKWVDHHVQWTTDKVKA